MSDGLPEGMELPELTAAQQADVARRERLREQLAKGRETRMRNRAERLAKQREVQERRAAAPRVMVAEDVIEPARAPLYEIAATHDGQPPRPWLRMFRSVWCEAENGRA